MNIIEANIKQWPTDFTTAASVFTSSSLYLCNFSSPYFKNNSLVPGIYMMVPALVLLGKDN